MTLYFLKKDKAMSVNLWTETQVFCVITKQMHEFKKKDRLLLRMRKGKSEKYGTSNANRKLRELKKKWKNTLKRILKLSNKFFKYIKSKNLIKDNACLQTF